MHIYCLRHTPGLKLRYYTHIYDADHEDQSRFFILTEDGVQAISRQEF